MDRVFKRLRERGIIGGAFHVFLRDGGLGADRILPRSAVVTTSLGAGSGSGTGPILLGSGSGRVRKRDGSNIVKLGGPADVRATFTRARHFDFGPPFAGDPWDGRPTLGACPRIRLSPT